MLLNPIALMLLLFFAGLLGGGARAWVTKAQATLSTRSAIDVVMGACFGVFIPRFADKVPIWGALSPIEQFFAVVILTYFFGDLLQNLVLSRFKAFVPVVGPAPITPPAPTQEGKP